MMCQERTGFLFAHDCDRPVVRACSVCRKALCEEHSRVTTEGHFCITCAQQTAAGAARPQPDPPATTSDVDRRWTSDDYDDDPFTYSSRHYRSYHYYDTNDYRAFDPPASEAADEDVEKDFAGS